LALIPDAAEQRHHLEMGELRKIANGQLNLRREFTRRLENQDPGSPGRTFKSR
jgi:hypothetical protein